MHRYTYTDRPGNKTYRVGDSSYFIITLYTGGVRASNSDRGFPGSVPKGRFLHISPHISRENPWLFICFYMEMSWTCHIVMPFLVGGFSPPLWKMMEFVSWDKYSIPNCFWKVIIHSFHGSKLTTNQIFSCHFHGISMAFPCHFYGTLHPWRKFPPLGLATAWLFVSWASQLMCRGVHLRASGTAFQLHRHLQRLGIRHEMKPDL